MYVFPWANAPIVDPKTKEEIGRLVGTDHRYKEDYEALYPEIHKGAYIVDSPKKKSEDEKHDIATSANSG